MQIPGGTVTSVNKVASPHSRARKGQTALDTMRSAGRGALATETLS